MKNLIKRTKEFLKNNWPRLIILAIVLTLFFFFCFNSHIKRLGISLLSLWNSLKYYWQAIAGVEDLVPPPTSFDIILYLHKGNIAELFPVDLRNFFDNIEYFGRILISPDFFNLYLLDIGTYASYLSIIINIILSLFIIVLVINSTRKYKPDDEAEDTKALTKYKKLKKKLQPGFTKLKVAYNYIFHSWLGVALLLTLICYLQLFTIAIDLLASYFYLFAEFKLTIIPTMLLMILIDFIPQWLSIPIIFRLIFIYWIFDLIRMNQAYKELDKLTEETKDFLNDTGNIILITGASRTGKTAFVTELSLFYEKLCFRPTLLNLILSIERKFPKFNWNRLNCLIDVQTSLKTQADINDFVFHIMQDAKSGKNTYGLFDEDLDKYIKWDNLTMESIFNAINDYAILYYFYNLDNPMLISNYPIMSNSVINPDNHYFNVDHFNLFKESKNEYLRRVQARSEETLSLINNFDYLKLGIKTNVNATDTYIPDLGSYAFTEMGKERGSTDDVKHASRNAKDSNIKNDKFNERLKIWSHIATIRYETLFKVIMDEQDAKGINVELRKTSETIITLDRHKKKRKFALKNWWIEQFLCKWILQKYDDYNCHRKEIKLNSSLPNYFIKEFVGHVNDYYIKRYNNFSYTEFELYNVNGSLSGVNTEVKNVSLRLFDKVAYSGRFASTVMRRLFLQQMRQSNMGITDLKHYSSLTPSIQEYQYQNSYMYTNYFKTFEKKETKKNDSATTK